MERPKVGDRVRVVFEGVVDAIVQSDLPYCVKRRRDDYYWHEVAEDEVEVLTENKPNPARSDTAIERRLVALEKAIAGAHDPIAMANRLVALEQGFINMGDGVRKSDNDLDKRLSRLEEIIKLLGRVWREESRDAGSDEDTPF